jgi:hypothetical protein
MRSPIPVAQDLASNMCTNSASINATRKECQQAAQKIHDVLSPAFEQTYRTPLGEAFTMVKEMNLQTKKSKAEKEKERRDCYKKAKLSMESKWKETEVVRQVNYNYIYYILLVVHSNLFIVKATTNTGHMSGIFHKTFY